MFERYWKPYFDTATTHAGNVLEKVLQSPVVLESISGVLNGLFRSKMVVDKALHLTYKGLGWPTYRDQKKILYYVTKLEGQLEDMQQQLDRLETWRQEWRELQTLREQFRTLQDQVERLQQRQDTREIVDILDASAEIHTTRVAEAVEQPTDAVPKLGSKKERNKRKTTKKATPQKA